MRADMGKVLVERPRLRHHSGDSTPGKGYRKRLQKRLDADEPPPAREGIRKRYPRNRKFFNENLAPLRRFLDASVGRPWDKVYAEICKHVDRGNVVQKHVLTHLFDYVVTRTVLIDGRPCRGEGYAGRRYGESLRTSHDRHQWYVCPKSGLLRRSKYVPHDYCKKPDPPRSLRLNKRQACVLRDSGWELITVELSIKGSPGDRPAYDAILREHIEGHHRDKPEARATVHRGGSAYTVTRRPLTRRDLLALPIPIDWLG